VTSAEDAGQPVESREDLIRWFREGEKPRERWRVGTEHEKIGLLGDTLERIPYEGERGIAAFLERLAAVDDQAVVRESGRPIALLQGEASITLEPGSKKKVRVKIERNPALTSDVEVNFKNLPAGVSAPKTTIPADQDSVEVELTAADDAKSAMAKNVTAQAQAKAGGKTFSAASGNVTVKIP